MAKDLRELFLSKCVEKKYPEHTLDSTERQAKARLILKQLERGTCVSGSS